MTRKRILNIEIAVTGRMSPYDYLAPAKHPTSSDWKEIYWLVQIKKGPMDGEYVEHYLKDLMGVPDLNLTTPIQYRRALRTLMQMPDTNIN